MDKLPYKEMKEIVSSLFLERGQQTKLNHDDCTAGHDGKQRLYIRHTDDGKYIFYCQHCSHSGCYSDAYARRSKKKLPDTTAIGQAQRASGGAQQRRLRSPITCRGFNGTTRAWLYKYGLTDKEIERSGIGWDAEERRIVLPVYRQGRLVCYQSRRTQPYGPKYITKKLRGHDAYYHVRTGSKTLAIVEDFLSGICCSRHCDSLAIFTTTIGAQALSAIVAGGYTTILVFLDDDNSTVKQHQRDIQRKLSLFCKDVRIVRAAKNGQPCDPKDLSNQELKELLV